MGRIVGTEWTYLHEEGDRLGIPSSGGPTRLAAAHLGLEKRLEDWIEADISIAAEDVLLLGRQVATSYGTQLDLLGIDARGDLVIIELKRDQTLRETVAQGIEYAAWASRLGYADVLAYAATQYGGEEDFRREFELRFKSPVPDALNAGQRILLVAPDITDATALVIEYLSDTYHVPINAVSFDLFTVADRTVLVRHHAIEEVQTITPPGAKRRAARTREEFTVAARDNGVGDAFEHLLTLDNILPYAERFVTTYSLRGRTPDKKLLAAFSLSPTAEVNPEVLGINMSPRNWSRLYGFSPEACDAFSQEMLKLGKTMQTWQDWVMVGITTLDQAREFDRRFREFVAGAPKLGGPELVS